MKFVFDNIEEIIVFLKKQGYTVEKNLGEFIPWGTHPSYPTVSPMYPPIILDNKTIDTTPKIYM